MLNPLALSRGSHYLENALRLALLAEIAYQDQPFNGMVSIADHCRRIQPFSLAGHFGFVASDDQNLVIAIRGTDQPLDWVTNLRMAQTPFGHGRAHRGFSDAVAVLWPEILQRVESLFDRGQTIWITGHSLGGALATLVAQRLAEAGIEPYLTCTFGAPRVFDPQAASRYLPRLFRFVTKGDLVPGTPPCLTLPWYRYQHTGSLAVVLSKSGAATTSLNCRAEDALRIVRWLFTPAIDWKQDLSQRLADHALSTYIRLIQAELGAEAMARLSAGQPAPLLLPARVRPRRAQAA